MGGIFLFEYFLSPSSIFYRYPHFHAPCVQCISTREEEKASRGGEAEEAGKREAASEGLGSEAKFAGRGEMLQWPFS